MAIKGKGKTRSRPPARAPRPIPVVVKPPFFRRRWVQVVGAFLARCVGAEDPAAPARAELLEQRVCLAGRENDLRGVSEPSLETVGGRGARAPGPQLLKHLVGLAPAEPDVATGAEKRFQPAGIALWLYIV